MIGHALGANDAAEARRLGDRMIQWGWFGGSFFLALILASIPVLPDLFSNDPAVISLVALLFIHVALWQPIAGIVFALDGILIGAGDLRFLAIAMVAATAVLIAGSFAVLGARSRHRLVVGCTRRLDGRPRYGPVRPLSHRRGLITGAVR